MNTTIGEIVATDFRTAAIFSKYNIDFCCKGNRTLEEACKNKNTKPDEINIELNQISNSIKSQDIDYNSWSLDFLSDYIINIHHKYIVEKTPILNQYITKLCKVHGANHPELFEINELFKQISINLATHMQKEELVLFPYIKSMINAKSNKLANTSPHFKTITNPITIMEEEHTAEGERIAKISELTKNYMPPEDACTTYKVTFQMLKDFQEDLHRHIHLENNILFPKAILIEKSFNN